MRQAAHSQHMFALLPTPPDLAPWVRCIWTLRTAPSGQPEPPIAPDGCCEWILHLATPPLMADGGGWARQPREFLFGQLTAPLRLHGDRAMTLLAVRFHPHALGVLLRVDGPALQAQPLDPAQMAPRLRQWHPGDTHERLATAYPALIATLRRLARQARPLDLRVAAALHHLDEQPSMRIAALSRQLETSVRTLERRFLQATGLGMKTYARIQRTQRSLECLSRPNAVLADVAQALGYADQAHLTRELAALAGRRPNAATALRLA